jgi:hypothetical protein
MHDAFGGNVGQMAFPALAGFDPIFFLHHCNVDRVFAIWQAANFTGRDSWFDDSNKQETSNVGTWTIDQDTQITSRTQLSPFRTGDGTYYVNSSQLQFWEPYGYTYPEVQDRSYIHNPQGFKLKLLRSFNQDMNVITWFLYVTAVSKAFNSGNYQIQIYLTNPSLDQKDQVPPFPRDQYVGTISIFSIGGACETCQIANTISAQFILNNVMQANGIAITPEPGTDSTQPNGYDSQKQFLTNSIQFVYADKSGQPIQSPPKESQPTITIDYKETTPIAHALADNDVKRRKIISRAAKLRLRAKNIVPNDNNKTEEKRLVESSLSTFESALDHFHNQTHTMLSTMHSNIEE